MMRPVITIISDLWLAIGVNYFIEKGDKLDSEDDIIFKALSIGIRKMYDDSKIKVENERVESIINNTVGHKRCDAYYMKKLLNKIDLIDRMNAQEKVNSSAQ